MSKPKDYQVSASFNFITIFQNLEATKPPHNYPYEQPDAVKIATIISEYLSDGWDGSLKGKNTPSDNVPKNDPQ